MKKTIPSLLFILLLLSACSPAPEPPAEATAAEANPAAPGFDAAGSDERAIAIADEVMEAQGGRQAWDSTRYIAWNFFGRRHLLWDKQDGRVRIDIPADSSIFLIDLKNETGQVMLNGQILENPDSLAKYVKRGKSIWINDSYWLVMPYKLKDSGVTLKYLGEDTTQAGQPADILQLTFEGVGDTPQNKYRVYVDQKSRLVTQWEYFSDAANPEPGFSQPWGDYRRYGGILLSGSRGDRELSDIRTPQEVSEQAFTSFEPVR